MPLSHRAILERLVAFPTVSRDTNLPLVDWVEEYLTGRGVAVARVPSADPRKAHLFAQAGPEVAGGIVLSGHSDVVPVDGQAWTTDPFTLVERDGKLYGRGACDMKGFDALAIAALVEAAALHRQGQLRRPLQLALSCDEELGCMAVIEMIDAMRAAVAKPSAVIVGEPTGMKVVTGHKGGVAFAVHARGHEVHSSLLHEGVSAIMESARLIEWANGRNAANAAATPGPLAQAFVPPFTTLHVGKIEGGTAHNITAKDCRFLLEIRVVPGEDPQAWADAVIAEARRISAGMAAVRPGTGLALSEAFRVPALAPETDGEAERLARRLTGDNGVHVVSYGTEGGQFQQRAKWSTVVCGPGDIAQAHQADEFLSREQFDAGWRFMQGVLDSLKQ
jgi:acetylornithine deacetylase